MQNRAFEAESQPLGPAEVRASPEEELEKSINVNALVLENLIIFLN